MHFGLKTHWRSGWRESVEKEKKAVEVRSTETWVKGGEPATRRPMNKESTKAWRRVHEISIV